MRSNLVFLSLLFSFTLVNSASAMPVFQEIAGGFDINKDTRPAIANNGNVAFIAGVRTNDARIVVEEAGVLNSINLSTFGLELSGNLLRGRAVQIRDEGDVIFVGQKTVPVTCETESGEQRGVYATDTTGSFLLPYTEDCFQEGFDGHQTGDISMSENGTVAFSTIEEGSYGAIYRGPVSGPVTALREASSIFHLSQHLDVNNAGEISVQMEYQDDYIGGLLRAVFIFDSVNQDIEDVDVAIEKMPGQTADVAINASGQVVLSNVGLVQTVGEEEHRFPLGVYVATPNPFNSALNHAPTNLVKIADNSGDYCGFGRVDINDNGRVVFEAALKDGLGDCAEHDGETYDGIFMGEDSVHDRVVTRGDDELGHHEFFDSVRLGELNNQNQVTLLSTYSEPLVDPTKVWRVDLNRLDNQRFWESLFSLIWTWFFSWWS